MFLIAVAGDFNGFLIGMAVGGLGFGVYVAVDLALVADVLPDKVNAAKDLGVLNMAGALPLLLCTGDRTGHPGDRRWELRHPVRSRRGLRDHRGGSPSCLSGACVLMGIGRGD